MIAPGYSSRCRACNSAHRPAIDERLLAGESTRVVSQWLQETHGERIPHQALLNHRGEHLNARAEAAAIVEAATPPYAAAVSTVVASAGLLDEVAGAAMQVVRGLLPRMSDPKYSPSMATVVLFNGALSNARASVTDRHELLHGKKLEVTGDGAPEPATPEAIHARAAALLAQATGGADPGPAREAEPE
jgi:hypothetical protein